MDTETDMEKDIRRGILQGYAVENVYFSRQSADIAKYYKLNSFTITSTDRFCFNLDDCSY